jgi:tetratricopeptide (TPR) repeat protein
LLVPQEDFDLRRDVQEEHAMRGFAFAESSVGWTALRALATGLMVVGLLVVVPRAAVGVEDDNAPVADDSAGIPADDAPDETSLYEPDDAGPAGDGAAVVVEDQGENRDAQVAVDTPPPKIEIEVATFNGAQPGRTTREELETLWGKPKESSEVGSDTVQQQYAVAPFDQVSVTLVKGVLTTILIQLEKAFPPEPLAKELQLDDIAPALVMDETGEPLGQAYPERGVIFTFAAGHKDQLVAQIILEPIDPQSFVLRAERHARARYRANLADLDYALEVNAELVRAHALRAKILADVGDYAEARKSIAAAIQREPQNAEYRLLQARIWEQLGDIDQALEETRTALGLAEKQPVWKAAALAQLGDQIAAGRDRDYKQAATHHQQAIQLAQGLVRDKRVAVKRVAQRVLLDAHLAMANDIAWGSWKNKSTAVPQWLKRAEKLIDDGAKLDVDVANDRFKLSQDALAAFVGLQGQLDPTPWVELLAKQGAELVEAADDPLARQRMQWELGMAYYDALQVYHMRREYPQALTYGGLAVSFLEDAIASREPIPGQAYLMGRLYFRVGSIHAVQQKDHAKAIPWFDRAVPLMEEPIPHTAMADIGRQGETFVSMAVSYWDAGASDEALRLTQEGLKLIEQAVEEEILDRAALAIPYSNLADMHRQLGDADKAKSFAEMAAQIQNQKRR